MAYNSVADDNELGRVADTAKAAAERAPDSIDNMLAFFDASNKRIAAMEVKTAK